MNRILAYFDLNNRQATTPFSLEPTPQPEPVPAGIGDNVLPDIQAVPFGARRTRKSALPIWKQAAFYLGTVIGVLFSSSIMQFQAGQAVTLNVTVTTAILSAVVGLMLLPFIEKKGLDPEAPFLFQFGLFVQNGVFWQVFLTLISKAHG